ncbi:MAG: bifunctional glutamate N-acetyltransferase/amino-acid acetyltransferase ArgJ [Candidatus Omnitrophica bacterium]|nr:bifunctional glutamate N-acetyltransferase/amino-acid acetyltransferase ArgJ [Candidatus Omnitrophota bacterium]
MIRMEELKGGVTAAQGFLAAGISCGLKKRGHDLALIASEYPATVAGTLTQNKIKAPCVEWTRKILRRGSARAVIANSGNANCCTGKQGVRNTHLMAQWTGSQLGLPAHQVIVASTGVIGIQLPMARIRGGISRAADRLHRLGSSDAAEAIMTTDTRPKEIAVRFKEGKRWIRLGGIAKGSGMIAPHMATMLAFLTTDAKVDASLLRGVLQPVVEETFNAITVDGEMSTNDMVILMANGASGAPALRSRTRAHRNFLEALRLVCRHLAHEIARDGEGVTRLMTVRVQHAPSREAAKTIAQKVANSALVKTMVAGRDPNWGRIAAAVGASGVPLDPQRLVIRLGGTTVFRNGEPVRCRRKILFKEVDRPEVQIGVDLRSGSSGYQILSGDLTEEYIRINAKYTT